MSVAHKGLDLILGKIQREPASTLVSRYLALVAEMAEPEKSERALDLAVILVKSKSSEALQIAHMVFRSDHANIRALDVMIAALNEKGRFGKAEVLRIERGKILKAKARADEPADMEGVSVYEAAATDDEEEYAGSEAFSEALMSQSRFAELDLGEGEPDSDRSGMLEALFPQEKLILGSLAEHPNDTVLPFRRGGAGAPAPGDAQTIHLADQAVPHTEPPPQSPGPSPAAVAPPGPVSSPALASAPAPRPNIFDGAPVLVLPPPEVAVSGFAAVIELFDYYWRQGFVTEARALLQQCAVVASQEPWWQVRHSQLEKSKLPFTPKLEAMNPQANVPLLPSAPGFWSDLRDEMKRVATSGKALMVPLGRVEKLTKLFRAQPHGGELPDEFIRALVEIDHRLPGLSPADVLTLKWSLFQGLWGAAPDLACAEALLELDLATANPQFFGFYLDALVAGGTPRRALVEIARVLPEKAQLAWANVVWRRLPLIWSLLHVHGFNWSEDDGVQALLTLLRRRPRPKLASVVAVSGRR